MDSRLLSYSVCKEKYKFHCLSSTSFPIEVLEQCIINSHENAATKIQTAWRGYQCRKAYQENKTKMKETNAALLIQRSFREWFHRSKNNESQCVFNFHKLDEPTIHSLQQEINCWSSNKTHFENNERLQLQLQKVQGKLKTFYNNLAVKNSKTEKCDALCVQIEAISNLLTNLPSLEQSDHLDVTMFQTPIVMDIKMAKLRHKQHLKIYSAPWWKLLNRKNEQ